jgi:hypothetical protein
VTQVEKKPAKRKRKKVSKKPAVQKKCQECGKGIGTGKRKKFCSNGCRQRAYRKNKS